VRKPSIAQARGLEADIVTVAGFNEVSGRMAAASVLGWRNRPSAFFAANGPAGRGGDGFDDIFIARLVSPSLTTVSQFQHDIGVTAAQTFGRGRNHVLSRRRRVFHHLRRL
jgi:LacI family transcriptional regulator